MGGGGPPTDQTSRDAEGLGLPHKGHSMTRLRTVDNELLLTSDGMHSPRTSHLPALGLTRCRWSNGMDVSTNGGFHLICAGMPDGMAAA